MKIKTMTKKAFSLRNVWALGLIIMAAQPVHANKPIETIKKQILETKINCHDISPQIQEFVYCATEFEKLVYKFMDARNKLPRSYHLQEWEKVRARFDTESIKPLETILAELKKQHDSGISAHPKETLARDIKRLTTILGALKEINEGIKKSCGIFAGYSGSGWSDLAALASKIYIYEHLLPKKIRDLDPLTKGDLLSKRFACDGNAHPA